MVSPPSSELASQAQRIKEWLKVLFDKAHINADERAIRMLEQFDHLALCQQKSLQDALRPVIPYSVPPPSGFHPQDTMCVNVRQVQVKNDEQRLSAPKKCHLFNPRRGRLLPDPPSISTTSVPQRVLVRVSQHMIAALCEPSENLKRDILDGAVVSRLTPDELHCRVKCIQELSPRPFHNLEVYYLLVLANVVWEWKGQLVQGDIVYIPAAIRDIIGQGAPPPPGMSKEQMCEEMQRRAFAMAGEVGLVFAQRFGGSMRLANRMENLDIVQCCGPEMVETAVNGDISAMRDAMRALNPSVPHIMMDSQNANNQLMRYFREYLDARAAAIGHPLRQDANIDHCYERNEIIKSHQ